MAVIQNIKFCLPFWLDYVFGGLREVDSSECSIKQPKSSKQCNVKPCTASDDTSTGNSSNSELTRKSKRNHNANYDHPIQSNHRLVIKVGGRATVFEHSLVKLKCPTGKYTKHDQRTTPLVWHKDNVEITSDQAKYHLSKNYLKIRNVQTNDTGVYKCSNQEEVNTMFLQVIKKDPVANQSTGAMSSDSAKSTFIFNNELDILNEIDTHSAKQHKIVTPKVDPVLPNKTSVQIVESDNSDETKQANKDSVQTEEPIPESSTASTVKPANDYDNLIASDEFSYSYHKSKSLLELLIKTDKYDSLQFNWVTSKWSPCTMPCGGLGFKVSIGFVVEQQLY